MTINAKTLAISIAVLAQISFANAAASRPVTLTTTMKSYRGDGAYLAIYVTDAQGKVLQTLHVAGRKAKYHKHLRDWNRSTGNARQPIDGVTGASVGSGRTLKVQVELADTLIDAGYQIRIDSSVEDQSDYAADAIAPLAKTAAGKPVAGKGYVQSLQFDM